MEFKRHRVLSHKTCLLITSISCTFHLWQIRCVLSMFPCIAKQPVYVENIFMRLKSFYIYVVLVCDDDRLIRSWICKLFIKVCMFDFVDELLRALLITRRTNCPVQSGRKREFSTVIIYSATRRMVTFYKRVPCIQRYWFIANLDPNHNANPTTSNGNRKR